MQIPPLSIYRGLAWRLIPSRFPPVHLFRNVAPPEDWDLLNEFEGLTNQRLVNNPPPAADCSHYISGPLSHSNPEGSLFADSSFGVLYAGLDFSTILAEVKFQRARFLRFTSEEPQRLDMRAVVIDVGGEFHDIRGKMETYAASLDASRALGIRLRELGSAGILFDSPNNPGGYCIAGLRTEPFSGGRQERHLGLVWDGNDFTDVLTYASSQAAE